MLKMLYEVLPLILPAGEYGKILQMRKTWQLNDGSPPLFSTRNTLIFLDLPLVSDIPILITNSTNITIRRNFVSRFQDKKLIDWKINKHKPSGSTNKPRLKKPMNPSRLAVSLPK